MKKGKFSELKYPSIMKYGVIPRASFDKTLVKAPCPFGLEHIQLLVVFRYIVDEIQDHRPPVHAMRSSTWYL